MWLSVGYSVLLPGERLSQAKSREQRFVEYPPIAFRTLTGALRGRGDGWGRPKPWRTILGLAGENLSFKKMKFDFNSPNRIANRSLSGVADRFRHRNDDGVFDVAPPGLSVQNDFFPALTRWANEFRRLRRLVVEANA
jgi:hypothetical protein